MHKILWMFAVLLVVETGWTSQTMAQDFNELTLVQFERQLNSILKTRRKEEKDYVAKVVKLVGENKIPRRLVNSSFKYVLKRRPNTKYPFVYFVRVLQFQGRREQVAIPNFDFNIYSNRQ